MRVRLEVTLCRRARNPTNGPITKMPTNTTAAMAIETAIWPPVSCCSSSTERFAEMVRARIPIDSACPRAITPRKPGARSAGTRLAIESIRWDSMWTLRSGRRTAIAHTSRPRIITPSGTACPP